MTKIDIFSGFLGAGKTTLIKKLISEAYKGENLVLIENEFGEIGIDGGFLKDAGIQITEMNSGCICCTLVGDFGTALKQVISQYHPDRILIEPSGVGKLSDVMVAVEKAVKGEAELGATVAVADATKVKLYMKNFGEFYNNQIETAGCIVLSRTQSVKEEKLKAAVELIRAHNDHATLVTTPWDELTGAQLKQAMESNPTLDDMMQELIAAHEQEEAEHEAEHHHHHDEHEHHHDHDEHEHHHDHDEHEHHHDHDEHEHHHDHDHDEHEHHHDHDHDEHDHHHHHHDADDIFMSWGMETPLKYSKEEIADMLSKLEDEETYGIVLRTKGVVPSTDGSWIEFDYVPGEADVRDGAADVTGKFCVIGSQLNQDNLQKLFRRL